MKSLITFTVAATLAAATAHASVVPSDAFVLVDAEQRVSADDPVYEQGTDLLDEHEWRRAVETFARVERMQAAHADASLYWQAYAYDKLAMRADALAKISQLRKRFPKSRWNEDAAALEVEIRHAMGELVRPDHVNDDDVKIIAVSGLMSSEPMRALPILDGMLRANKPVKVKERALFVIAQSDVPEARKILVRIAQDNNGNVDLRTRAIKYLGIVGADRDGKILINVYNSTPSVDVKRSILRTYTITGDRARLLALAKSERNEELRGDVMLQLGTVGATKELADLYSGEQSERIRRSILQAMAVGGNADRLFDIAARERNLTLKCAAIRDLGMIGGDKNAQRIIGFYDRDVRHAVRTAVLNALAVQGNATALRNLAQREKDVALKQEIDAKLAALNAGTIDIDE